MLTNIPIYVYIGIGLSLILFIWLIRLEMRFKKLFAGKDGSDLEDTMKAIIDELKDQKKTQDEILAHLMDVETRLKRSIQGIQTVRFNPFTDQGSNQSFAIALMSEDGNGVVLSSLYSRERVSVFAKPIIKFKSEFELTEEEKAVLKKATL